MPNDRPLMNPNEYHSPYHTTLTTREIVTLRHATQILARLAAKVKEVEGWPSCNFHFSAEDLDKIILQHTVGGALQREEPSHEEDTHIAGLVDADHEPVTCAASPWLKPGAFMFEIVNGPDAGKRGPLSFLNELARPGVLWPVDYVIRSDTGEKITIRHETAVGNEAQKMTNAPTP